MKVGNKPKRHLKKLLLSQMFYLKKVFIHSLLAPSFRSLERRLYDCPLMTFFKPQVLVHHVNPIEHRYGDCEVLLVDNSTWFHGRVCCNSPIYFYNLKQHLCWEGSRSNAVSSGRAPFVIVSLVSSGKSPL